MWIIDKINHNAENQAFMISSKKEIEVFTSQ